MRIAKNIEMLELPSDYGNLHPVPLWDDRDIVLIDTGMPNQMELLEKRIAAVGYSANQVTHIILTHQDLDHIGCAKRFPKAKILAHEAEIPYLQGDIPFLRLTNMERHLSHLRDDEQVFYERLKAAAPQFYLTVDQPLHDGEFLQTCGGIKVLHTPGHTPGHISLLIEASHILVAGDACTIINGQLVGADPQYSHDILTAQLSFQKLQKSASKAVICYHGGLFESPR